MGEGEARSTPGGSARQGDGGRGGPVFRANATEPGGQSLRWGRAHAGIPTHLGAALALLLAGEGLETQKPDFLLYLPSRHPEQVKELEGSGRGWQTGPPGLNLHLPWSPSNSRRMGVDLISALFPSWGVAPRPLDQQADPRAAAKGQLPPTH